MKKNILKGLTLTSFLLLIGLFVTYRAGYFGPNSSPVPMSPNGSVINSNATDTVASQDTVQPERTIISSSKSMIIRDFNIKEDPTQRDSMMEYLKEKGVILRSETQRKQDSIFEAQTTDQVIKKKTMFSGSKSGPVIQWEDLIKIVKDSTATDSLKNEKDG